MKKKNLLSIAKKTIGGSTIEDSSIFHNKYAATSHYDMVYWTFDEQMAFDYSNTFYVALSVKGAAASTNTLSMIIQCKDADGTTYWRSSSSFPITKNWARVEGTITIPNDTDPVAIFVAEENGCPELWVTSLTLAFDQPITLASSIHTPYATDSHLRAEYATQASLDNYKTTNDQAVAAAKKAGTDAQSQLGSYQSTNDAAVAAVKSTADAAQSTADDAYSRTLRVQISSSPADATGDTSMLTATVWRGGEQLTEEDVAKLGIVCWLVNGVRKATGYTHTAAAGASVECRLEGWCGMNFSIQTWLFGGGVAISE